MLIPIAVYPELSRKIDSLKYLINKETVQSVKLDYLLKLAEYQIEYGSKEAVISAEEAFQLANSQNHKYKKANAYKLRGISWRIWGDNTKSVEYLFSSLKIFKELSLEKETAEVIRNIGETYRASANLAKSRLYLLEAEELFKKNNDSIGLAKTYNRLAATSFELFYSMPDFYNEFPRYKKDSVEFTEIYRTRESVRKRYDSVTYFIDLAYKYANAKNLAGVVISTGIIEAALYSTANKYDKARRKYIEIIDIIEKTDNQMEMPLVYHNFAVFFYYLKDYKNSLKYAEISYKKALQLDVKTYLYLSAGLIAFSQEGLKNYVEAIKFHRIADEARNSYLNQNIGSKLLAMNYENELKMKETEIQNRKEFTKYIIIFAAAIISTIVIFAFLLLRKNRKVTILNDALTKNNETISEQNQKLEKMNIEKDKFFSIIAHDLKNPIGSFKLTTNLLYDSYDTFSTDDLKEFIAMLKDSSNNLHYLLENLLEWSRAQRGKIEYNPTDADLSSITRLTIDLLKPIAEHKNISIKNNIPDEYKIIADPNLLTTVLRNLISNALKFTRSGGLITVGISDNDDDHLSIYVKDNGVGIPEEVIGKLFRIDKTVTTLGTEREKGTGLGLVLCKEFIEMHNGSIEVQSKVGEGTTFNCVIPRK